MMMERAEDGGAREAVFACRKPPTAAKWPEGLTDTTRGSKSTAGEGRKARTAARTPPPTVRVAAVSASIAPRIAALTCRAGEARMTPSAPSA